MATYSEFMEEISSRYKKESLDTIYARLSESIGLYRDIEDYEAAANNFAILCQANEEKPFCAGLISLCKDLSLLEQYVLNCFVNHFIQCGVEPMTVEQLPSLPVRREVGTLISKGYVISIADDNGKKEDHFRYALSPIACHHLFYGQNAILDKFSLSDTCDYIRWDAIPEKQLIFGEDVFNEYQRLSNLLMPDKYERIISKLAEKNKSQCLSIVMYGPPGTGKSESVKQIARLTHRDIVKADVSKIIGRWYGESEKALRALFRNLAYVEQITEQQRRPILLLEECDSLMGPRFPSPHTSNDHLNNVLQDILLQEFENCNSIICCTTNMPKWDTAFDRRLLMKVYMPRPSHQTQSRIWKAMISFLSEKECQELAELFSFSPAEIENISKKIDIEEILFDRSPSFEEIKNLCCADLNIRKEERAKPIVGFADYGRKYPEIEVDDIQII